MEKSIVFVHSGRLPSYISDCIFQTIFMNTDKKYNQSISIHVIIEEAEFEDFENSIKVIDWDLYNLKPVIKITSIESLRVSKQLRALEKSVPYTMINFRGGFWLHTISRFIILEKFMKVNCLPLVFHIENDVMVYNSFNNIYNRHSSKADSGKIWVVKDSPKRVVPSIMFFPSITSITLLVSHIYRCLSMGFSNDMDLLGSYQDVYELPTIPNKKIKMVFDGAAIGQYLGGIDPRNIGKNFSDGLDVYLGTRGFKNETAEISPSLYEHNTKMVYTGINNARVPILLDKTDTYLVANLHVHSKNLASFSSANITRFENIISGDRILDVCDFIFTTKGIHSFHRNHNVKETKFILVKNFENIDKGALSQIFKTQTKTHVKLFVYTHILYLFQKYILKYLPGDITYTLYCGNSDHSFDETYLDIAESKKIIEIYAQNLNVIHNKCTVLPIGIANRMWKHGDIPRVYEISLKVYNKQKIKSIYVNINPKTFPYRRVVLDKCIENGLEISNSLPFSDYLKDLATHRFCLCVRGNGLDTHRFWEALYLGVVPVVIDNEETVSRAFYKNLQDLDIPFVSITNLDNLKEESFSYSRYKSIMRSHTSRIHLTLSGYTLTG